MVRFYKEQFGRGPEKVFTHYSGPDTIVSILGNLLSPVERSAGTKAAHAAIIVTPAAIGITTVKACASDYKVPSDDPVPSNNCKTLRMRPATARVRSAGFPSPSLRLSDHTSAGKDRQHDKDVAGRVEVHCRALSLCLELRHAACGVGRREPRVDLRGGLRLPGLEQVAVAIQAYCDAGVAEDHREILDADT